MNASSMRSVDADKWVSEDFQEALKLYDFFFFGGTLQRELARRRIRILFHYNPRPRTKVGKIISVGNTIACERKCVKRIGECQLTSGNGVVDSVFTLKFKGTGSLFKNASSTSTTTISTTMVAYENAGIECRSVMQLMMTTFEHELVHLILHVFAPYLLVASSASTKMPSSSSSSSSSFSNLPVAKPKRILHGKAFKTIAKNCFGHTRFTHSFNADISCDQLNFNRHVRTTQLEAKRNKSKELKECKEFQPGSVITLTIPVVGHPLTEQYIVYQLHRTNATIYHPPTAGYFKTPLTTLCRLPPHQSHSSSSSISSMSQPQFHYSPPPSFPPPQFQQSFQSQPQQFAAYS